MTTGPWNHWLRSPLSVLTLASLTLLATTLTTPGQNRAGLHPASVTLIVDGMMKSRSGAT